MADNTCLKIEDEFGKKIGGSKRDLWSTRGLITSDLDEMNDAELLRDVKKNNIFKTPNYKKMKEEGADPRVLYFIKLVKDNLATAPILRGREWAEAYVRDIAFIRDRLLELKTVADCEAFCNSVLIGEGFVEAEGYRRHSTPRGQNIGAGAVFNVTYNTTAIQLEKLVAKKEFLYSDYEKFAAGFFMVPRKIASLTFDRELPYIKLPGMTFLCKGMTQEIFDNIGDEELLLVLKSHQYIAAGSKEGLDECIKALYDCSQTLEADEKKSKKPAKKRFVPENIEICKRTRNGIVCNTKNVTTDEMLSAFKFHGGEFGTWENDDTRQDSLDKAYDAFHDLALVLGINPDQVAFGERLSIAFGARGNSSAAAHFEPAREVINLTKTNGSGSLAHEYGHAIDFICSYKLGNTSNFTSGKRQHSLESMSKLIDAMMYKTTTVAIDKSEKTVLS